MPDEWLDRRAAEVAARTDLAVHGAAGAMATHPRRPSPTPTRTSIDRLEELVERQEADALAGDGDPAPALRRNAGARTIIAEVRRSCGQLREVVGVFVRRELLDTVHTAELDLELRDVLDHVIRSHEDLDTLHDRMSALADTRLAMVAYRQNEITKKLSAWAAVLLVPTIVTGWFGMNFHHMVGLANRYGEVYALVLIVGRDGRHLRGHAPRPLALTCRRPSVATLARRSISVTPSGRPALTQPGRGRRR